MRKIFLHIMVSLDGYLDGPDGEMDWHFVHDEYKIIINPVVLGGGTPLFPGGYDSFSLKLLNSKKFQSGAILLNYKA